MDEQNIQTSEIKINFRGQDYIFIKKETLDEETNNVVVITLKNEFGYAIGYVRGDITDVTVKKEFHNHGHGKTMVYAMSYLLMNDYKKVDEIRLMAKHPSMVKILVDLFSEVSFSFDDGNGKAENLSAEDALQKVKEIYGEDYEFSMDDVENVSLATINATCKKLKDLS